VDQRLDDSCSNNCLAGASDSGQSEGGRHLAAHPQITGKSKPLYDNQGSFTLIINQLVAH
jgi:hypothetical protein